MLVGARLSQGQVALSEVLHMETAVHPVGGAADHRGNGEAAAVVALVGEIGVPLADGAGTKHCGALPTLLRQCRG